MTPARVIVTGATGALGREVAALLVGDGHIVYGTWRDASPSRPAQLENVDVRVCELTDERQVRQLVAEIEPDAIVHCAGSRPPASVSTLLRSNVLALANVLWSAKERARIVVIGSSAEYGRSGKTPIDENRPLRPVTEYGLTKAFEYQLSRLAIEQGAHVVYARPFNLIGPAVPTTNALSDFARRIASIVRNEAPPFLSVGNLDVWRDFTDVRDAARACVLLLSAPSGGVYNICSGRATQLSDALDLLIRASGIPIEVTAVGGIEAIPFQVGDPSQVQRLGWRPHFPLEVSLSDSLDWWIQAHA